MQDKSLQREELRIKAKREANEERRKRFLNARSRLIGLDVAALDQQVAEKEERRRREQEITKLERKEAFNR
jgi:hypothetical protein